MKRTVRIGMGVLLAAALAGGAVQATAGVNVNINLGPPPVIVDTEPEMVVVPHSSVYFAPRAQVDLFFFGGAWWTCRDGRWFRGRGYNGPWTFVQRRHVPREVVVVPPNYRDVYGREEHIPYGQWKKHWRDRERMHDWKEEKREHKWREKEARREWKEERREERRDDWDRGPGRGHGRGRD